MFDIRIKSLCILLVYNLLFLLSWLYFQGVDCFPGVGQEAGDATEKEDDTTAAGTLNSQGPEEEDLEQDAGNAQQHKGLRKRAGAGGLVGDKATKQFKTRP